MPRVLPLGLLLAASTLSAQSVLTLSGAGGLANESYSAAIDTTGGTTLGLEFAMEYLVVAGGGGGGGSGTDSSAGGGAGGGAGGMLSGTLALSSTSSENAFTITVGAGGAGGQRNASTSLQQGSNGGDSAISRPIGGTTTPVVTALGGGGGGAYKVVGNIGGSGGGGGGRGTGNNLRTAGGAGTAGQGNAGGASRDDDSSGRSAGGGGGGAGGQGGQGGTDSSIGGNGGIGLASAITGSSVLYAAGGGGGAIDTNSGAGETAGTGGSSIGGNGSTSGNASAGAANTGSGGGGVGHQGVGGAGGSGVVIVRYKGSAATSGGSISSGTGSAAGYTLHTFASTGNTSLNLGSLNLDTRMGTVVSSDVSGTGALTIDTKGTVRFTGTASHTGGTVVSDGSLHLGDGGAGGSLSGDVTLAGGTALEYNRSADTSLRLSSSGSLTKKGSGALTISDGDTAFTGSISVNTGTLRLGSSFGPSGEFFGLNGGRLSSDGQGARTLARSLGIYSNVALGDTVNQGALLIDGPVNIGMFTNTLTVDSEVVISGEMWSGYGGVGLTKQGAGKLVLSGVNTYNGITTVKAGTLIVNGSQSYSEIGYQSQGVHIIESGATLGGSGLIQGDTFISGIHAPGNSPGVQNFSRDLTYQEGSGIQWELAGQTDAAGDRGVVFDGIDVAGDLTFSGSTLVTLAFALAGSSVDWANPFWSENQSWKLFDVGGSVFGFENLTLGDASALLDSQGETFGLSLDGAQFALAYRSGDIYVDYTAAIPEPSTYGLMLGALALAGAAVRRRKAKQA